MTIQYASDEGTGVRAPALDWRFGLSLAVIFLAVLLPRIAAHDLWRDEWHVWLLAREAPTLASLFDRLRYDGHPATWYLINWLGTRVTGDPLTMKLAHAAIATMVVGVIAVAAPFARWQRVLLACGYFFAFEYAAISRNYGLGALGLLLAAACHARAPTRPIATCLALALAVHSNAFAGLVACAIATYLALVWWFDRRAPRGTLLAGLAIVGVSAVLVVIENRPPPDLNNTPWRLDVDIDRVGRLAAALWRSFVPIPSPTRQWWGTNVLDFTLRSPVFRVTQAVLGLAVLVLSTLAVAKDWRLRGLWLAIVGLTFTFAYLKITGSLRHHGTLLVCFIALHWIGRTASDAPAVGREPFWRATLAAQAVAGVIASVADVSMPFTAVPATAAYIRANYPTAQVVTQRDFEGSPLAGELGRPVYFPVPGRWATHVVYNDRRSERASPERLNEVGAALHAEDPKRPVLLVVSDESIDRPDETHYRFLVRLDDASMSSERFNLYLWQPEPR